MLSKSTTMACEWDDVDGGMMWELETPADEIKERINTLEEMLKEWRTHAE
ncbi:hypothetical protein [Klebsiella oxytoca]